MSPISLLGMRKAAALAFAVPGLEVDVVHDGKVVARIERRFGGADLALSTTLLSPCMFRSAVGRAHTHARAGGTAMFLGLGSDSDPALRYHMPFTGAARPLGLVVSRVGETVVHVFATQRPTAAVDTVLRSMAMHPALPDEAAVSTSWDSVTDITLVYTEMKIGLLATSRPFVEAMMESLMVRFGVDEITQAVATQASRTGG